ncbi:sialate O-acetylesterase [Thalassobius sp. I31.1]|uniref:sialate O-acetylesterase n=1 Tax=Thalassobius sp. I31.1 TaxID=2109912 RepID=UPI000D19953F|nr:sialate O-acetylesterase [Thalassobius sp. I31.1]
MTYPHGGAASIWRDNEGGSRHNPSKSQIRDWGSEVEAGLEALSSNHTPEYLTVSVAAAADIAAPQVVVEGERYRLVTGSYEPTHEFQFTDGEGRRFVREDMLRINDRMPIVVVASGQSNILGSSSGTGGDIASQAGVWSYERHTTGSQTTGWKLGFKESPDYPTGQAGNHFPYHFCARLARETNRPVCMIPYAIGGQDIAEWLPSGGGLASATGTLWTNLLSARNQALTVPLPFRSDGATLTDLGLGPADYLLWHQGEENRDSTNTYPSGNQATQFKRDTVRVFGAFLEPSSVGSIATPLIREDTPIIIGDLAYGGSDGIDDRNPELYQLANEIENISLAKIGWMPTSDGVHFGPTHIERIADKYTDAIRSTSTGGFDVSLEADALFEFRPSHVTGQYSIIETSGASRQFFMFGYRSVASSGQISPTADLPAGYLIDLLSNVDLNTLGNAASGRLSVSSSNGVIQLRNRRGSALNLRIQCLTPQPLPGYTG